MAVTLVAVFIGSLVATGLARRYALRRHLLDEPGERRSHRVATPRGGGLGPALALAAFLAFAPAADLAIARPVLAWLGLVLVAGVGAWDDHRALPAVPRLAVHAVASLLLVHGLDLFAAGALVALAAAFAVVAAINIWNFMDGIDGIAATQAALFGGTVAYIAGAPWTVPAAALGVAMLGFLPFNFPVARIFMGDVGSGAVGFAVALVGLGAAAADPRAGLAALLPASAFLVDSGMTLGRRIVRGERWWTPHTQHAYQGLARRYGHVRVTLGYAAWTLSAGLFAVVLAPREPGFILPCVAMWYMAAAALWFYIQRRSTHRDAAQ